MTKLKKAIVLGGSGFLGSHVADCLTKQGFSVTIFDKRESPYLMKDQKMIVGDILNTDSLNDAISGNDIVYNFAGIADIDECHKNPVETVKYNILGNAIIMESSVKNNVSKYLFASSAYVYSKSGSFYRISKQSSELFIESYSEQQGIEYAILRYGSLYGERANRKNSLHRMIDSAVREGKIDYFGDGSETREFIHVKDAAELSVEALEEKYNGQILMLTGSKSIKYKELLDMISEMFQSDINVAMHPSDSATHYKMSPYSFNPKMAKKLVSNPHIDLGQGILNLIEELHKNFHSK